MSLSIQNIHIGEVKLGSSGVTLQALLGSCVGLAIIWPQRKLFGLAHCLLDYEPEQSNQIGGRYVDQAIRSLLTMMNATPQDYHQIRAVVAGGANMTKPVDTKESKLIGFLNVKSAREELSKLNIKIVYQDTGGTNGRKIYINCEDGSYQIKTIPKTVAA